MTWSGTFGFLGFGNMGAAILGGLLKSGTLAPGCVRVFDVDAAKCEAARAMGVAVVASEAELARACDALLLAVKPQNMNEALEALKSGFAAHTLVISIAAGISIAFIRKRLGDDVRVIRVMPNTPALVGAGAAGIAPSDNCTEKDKDVALTVFGAVGIAEIVPEQALDAVTALSGSGPAYFFYTAECLLRAAMAEGLDETAATRLVAQTMLGAGKLLTESGESAATLRARVTSKGGTTAAALATFEREGLERTLAAGVAAAAARSRELGQ
ncbi:MAG TPA: pyrroline-5-carboxylate reductase [Candidatus Hydrogenedentes bacterium]|nr:pyrroline-5-carboxylate reductase [Candidatus Hydrogenedentota bacterium]HPG68362.1 pyrroline-5-carboxylate reductase [Candidatus Hydrogenedentota bacterium]